MVGFGIAHEEQRRDQDHPSFLELKRVTSRFFALSHWKNGVAANYDGETRREAGMQGDGKLGVGRIQSGSENRP